MVVDSDMDELPTGRGAVSALTALAVPVTGDAVSDPIEFAQILDVYMDHLTGTLAFIATHRLDRVDVP